MSEKIVVKFFPDAVRELQHDKSSALALRGVAQAFAKRVRPPKDQRISTRAGVGTKGAFSQVQMSGPRAIFIEFGTLKQRALSPLRSAIFGHKVGR